MKLGVYIHFPWCRKRCSYCDFAIAVAKPGGIPKHREYLAAVLRELDAKADMFVGSTLVAIYFGGGTPSLWAPECIAEVIAAVRTRFGAQQDALEVNLECNPIDCTPQAFTGWLQAGVNRVLVGVQATNTADLVTLGRDHSMGDGVSALQRTLREGFSSVGADVIWGIPNSIKPLASLREVAQMGVPHVSAYELTIEERTPLAKSIARKELQTVDEDVLATLYMQTHDVLTAAGYEHYEVSSYAKPGHRAVHNSLYWQGANYLGLGNGAASLCNTELGAQRWQNYRSVTRYLQAEPLEHVQSCDDISHEEFAVEKCWLAMRTSAGVPLEALAGRENVVEQLLKAQLVVQQKQRIIPTVRGFLYNNQIIRLLGAD